MRTGWGAKAMAWANRVPGRHARVVGALPGWPSRGTKGRRRRVQDGKPVGRAVRSRGWTEWLRLDGVVGGDAASSCRKASRSGGRAMMNRTLVCRGLEARWFLVGVHEVSMRDDDTQGGQVP